MSEYAVEMLNISKSFHGHVVNDNITLRLRKGEIHALLGENGAGKSTLMNILFGLIRADSGQIIRDGKPVNIHDPNDATALGIGMVHQHFRQVQCYTVLQNIVLGAETLRGVVLDMKTARKKVMALSEKYGLAIDPDVLIEDITVGMQQRVEILKMLYRDNEVLILDEPTAVLTVQEANELLTIMQNLKKEGKTLLFISHKMNEIMRVSDTCTVIRKGAYVGSVPTAQTTVEELSEMMVGHKVDLNLVKIPANPGKEILAVRNLSARNPVTKKQLLNDVTFRVRAGEIVCIAGIDGNGQNELVEMLTGSRKGEGVILLNGEDITKETIRQRSDRGIAYIPVDRLRDAMISEFTMAENLILKRYHEPEFQNPKGIMNQNAIQQYAEKLMAEYDVRAAAGTAAFIGKLSGGNQQKAVVGRELDRNPELIIAVQPVRGVDILATKNIHQLLIDARDHGKAVLLVSLELSEVMSLSDRILVMFEGEIAGEFTPETTSVEELGLYMTGAKRRKK